MPYITVLLLTVMRALKGESKLICNNCIIIACMRQRKWKLSIQCHVLILMMRKHNDNENTTYA